MKYPLPFLFALLFIAITNWCNAQRLNFSKEESTLKEAPVEKIFYKTISVTGIPKNQDSLLVKINAVDLDATIKKDYDFLPGNSMGTRIIKKDSNIITIGIIVKPDNFNKENNEQFVLTYSYDSLGESKTLNDTVTIQDLNFNNTQPDTSKFTVRIVTGSNFDFFDAPTFKNFAGDLNIFLPDLFKPIGNTKKRIGLNCGVFNYRYYEADSSGSHIITENYLTDPTTTKIIPDTTHYVKDVYSLNSKTTYNNWGVYFDPMIRLNSDTKIYDLYLELHAEVIWRTEILTYNQLGIRKDTFTIASGDITRGSVFQSYKGIQAKYTQYSYFDSYFGLGLPMKIDIKKAFEFFATPSFGFSSFQYTGIDTSFVRSNIRYRTLSTQTASQAYFLTKFQLVTTVAPVDIALGGEYRKIFGQKAFFGMYLGASISLDKLKK